MRRRAHASAAAAPPRLSLLLPTLILLVVGLVAPPARADSAAFFCGDAASSPGLAREHALPSRLFGGRLAAFCCAGGVDDRLFTGADCEKAGVGKWRNTYGVDLNYCWGWRTPACCVDMVSLPGGGVLRRFWASQVGWMAGKERTAHGSLGGRCRHGLRKGIGIDFRMAGANFFPRRTTTRAGYRARSCPTATLPTWWCRPPRTWWRSRQRGHPHRSPTPNRSQRRRRPEDPTDTSSGGNWTTFSERGRPRANALLPGSVESPLFQRTPLADWPRQQTRFSGLHTAGPPGVDLKSLLQAWCSSAREGEARRRARRRRSAGLDNAQTFPRRTWPAALESFLSQRRRDCQSGTDEGALSPATWTACCAQTHTPLAGQLHAARTDGCDLTIRRVWNNMAQPSVQSCRRPAPRRLVRTMGTTFGRNGRQCCPQGCGLACGRWTRVCARPCGLAGQNFATFSRREAFFRCGTLTMSEP